MTKIQIRKQPILLNSHIKVNDRPLYNSKYLNYSQLRIVDHLYNENRLLDRNMINIVYDLDITVMEYNSIISAIPQQ